MELHAGDVQLVDAGVRRRLERFGSVLVDRPAPTAEAFRRAPAADWDAADLRFDPGRGWSGPAWPAEPWSVTVDGLTLELRPTSSGGLGLYPEHASSLDWLAAQVSGRTPDGRSPVVLNLFGHTGLAALALARAGAAVTHVDGSRTAVAWARRNAELSGLADRPVRWIVDDAAAFVAREARRARQYDGIVLDPPAFGRGRGREWRLETDLPRLLAGCAAIAAPGAFVLLTAHAEAMTGDGIASLLAAAFRVPGVRISTVPMELRAEAGAVLRLGWSARLGD